MQTGASHLLTDDAQPQDANQRLNRRDAIAASTPRHSRNPPVACRFEATGKRPDPAVAVTGRVAPAAVAHVAPAPLAGRVKRHRITQSTQRIRVRPDARLTCRIAPYALIFTIMSDYACKKNRVYALLQARGPWPAREDRLLP